MIRCSRCRKPNRSESRHCGHCGAALVADAGPSSDSTMVGASPFSGVDPLQAAVAEALGTARAHTPPGRSEVDNDSGTLAGIPVSTDSTSMGMPAMNPALAAFRPGASPEQQAENGSTLMMHSPLAMTEAQDTPARPGPASSVGSKTLFGMQAAEMQLGLVEAMAAAGPRPMPAAAAAAPEPAGMAGMAAMAAPQAARVRTRAPVPRASSPAPAAAPRAPARRNDDFDSAAFDSTPTPDPFRLERGRMTSDTPQGGSPVAPSATPPPGQATGMSTKVERPRQTVSPSELFQARKAPETPAPSTPRPAALPRPALRGGPIRLPDSDAAILRVGQAASGVLLLASSLVMGAQAFWFRPEMGVHMMADVLPVVLGAVSLALAAPRTVPIWERSAVGGLGLFTALMLGFGLGAEPFSAGVASSAHYVMILVGCLGLFLVGLRSIWDPDGDDADGEGSRAGGA